jgi:hypothetical protein
VVNTSNLKRHETRVTLRSHSTKGGILPNTHDHQVLQDESR